jgi:hypothetical protein
VGVRIFLSRAGTGIYFVTLTQMECLQEIGQFFGLPITVGILLSALAKRK